MIFETVVLVVIINVDSGDDAIGGVYADTNGALIVKVVVVVTVVFAADIGRHAELGSGPKSNLLHDELKQK